MTGRWETYWRCLDDRCDAAVETITPEALKASVKHLTATGHATENGTRPAGARL